jgi:hypothetical protein
MEIQYVLIKNSKYINSMLVFTFTNWKIYIHKFISLMASSYKSLTYLAYIM